MLVDLPKTNQLMTQTNDGKPSENARADCVAACVASVVNYFRHADLTPDGAKDGAYGDGYVGATDPMHYAGVLSRYGIAITQFDSGSGAALSDTIIATLRKGQPCMGAIPSQWGSQDAEYIRTHGGGTHEVAFCDYDGRNLTAMNPWPADGQDAFFHTMPVAWWQSRLVYGRVNPMEGSRVAVPSGWKDDSKTITAPNKQVVVAGFAQYIRDHAWDAANVPLEAEHGRPGGGTQQVFTFTELEWTSQNGVNPAPLGQHVLDARAVAAKAQADLAAANQQIVALQAQIATLQQNQGLSNTAAQALKDTVAVLGPLASAYGEISTVLKQYGK